MGSLILCIGALFTQIPLALLHKDRFYINNFVGPGAALLYFLFIYALNKRGSTVLASYLFCSVYFIFGLFVIFTWGTQLPEGVMLFALGVITSSLLIGSRAGTFFTLLTGVAYIGVTNLHQNGKIVPDLSWSGHLGSYIDAIVYTLSFGILMVTAWLSNREISRAFARAQEAERVLRHEKHEVENKVEERTAELQISLESTETERDKISTIVQSIGDAVFVLNDQQIIILVNKITEELSGYSEKELIGQPYPTVLKFVSEADDTDATFIETVYKTGKQSSISNHTVLIRKDGSRIPVADSAAPLFDTKHKITGCVVVFRNVTRERELEQMKDEFLSLASHQLRSPLTALRWESEHLLRQKVGPLNPGQVEVVNDLHQSTSHLIDLVNDLLDLSKMNTGKIPINLETVNLPQVIAEVLHELGNRFEERQQRIVIEGEKELPLVRSDVRLTHHVLQNFLVNAGKYSPKGTIITIHFSHDTKMAKIAVTDQGYGIPKEEQEHIFEKFYRGNSKKVEDTEGTGLGLYLTKHIVESLGGTIAFQSKEAHGTTFWFTLPIIH